MPETSLVEINLAAIDRNMRTVRSLVGASCGLCPIVKADAYGLGATRVARRLVVSGADMLAVYTTEQAAALARLGLAAPILILMPVQEIGRGDDLRRSLVAGSLHLTLHDAAQLERLRRLARSAEAVVPVHVEVDTGMARGGSLPEDALRLLGAVASSPEVRLAGVFTHFSDPGDDPERTGRQLASFDEMLAGAGGSINAACVRHVASTVAMLRHPRFHRGMVRFGLAWAGYGAEALEAGECLASGAELEPAVTWSSTLVHVRRVPRGTSVGYGSRWTAAQESVLGLVPVGYADGYPRALPGAPGPAHVAVLPEGPVDRRGGCGRVFVPVVGAVNMDQITIDLTDVAGRAGVGTRVELVTPDPAAPNHLPRVARAAGTIPHELLCRFGPRARRSYRAAQTTELAVPQPTRICV